MVTSTIWSPVELRPLHSSEGDTARASPEPIWNWASTNYANSEDYHTPREDINTDYSSLSQEAKATPTVSLVNAVQRQISADLDVAAVSTGCCASSAPVSTAHALSGKEDDGISDNNNDKKDLSVMRWYTQAVRSHAAKLQVLYRRLVVRRPSKNPENEKKAFRRVRQDILWLCHFFLLNKENPSSTDSMTMVPTTQAQTEPPPHARFLPVEITARTCRVALARLRRVAAFLATLRKKLHRNQLDKCVMEMIATPPHPSASPPSSKDHHVNMKRRRVALSTPLSTSNEASPEGCGNNNNNDNDGAYSGTGRVSPIKRPRHERKLRVRFSDDVSVSPPGA